NGLSVVAVEKDDAGVARARALLESSTARAVSGGKLDADDRTAILARVALGSDPSALAGVDLVIEAVTEDLEVKRAVFRSLDGIVGGETVLATNTSSLSVTELSVATANPRRVVGLHFFNPAPVIGFVEIVRTLVTDATVIDGCKVFIEKLGMTPVVCGDKAGFITNALLFGYLNHAATMFESRYASREDLDAAMMYGCGYPMGPLALIDLIGLDIT